MRMLTHFTAITIAVLLLGAWAAPSPPQRFTMSFFGFPTGPGTAEGTWSSTGSIDEVGGFSMTLSASGNQPPGAPPTYHASIMLSGKQGTIELKATLHQALGTGHLTGPVLLVEGTAFYAGINGHGSADLSLSPTDLTGTVSGQRTH